MTVRQTTKYMIIQKGKIEMLKKKQEINQENKKVLSNTMYRTERISIEHP